FEDSPVVARAEINITGSVGRAGPDISLFCVVNERESWGEVDGSVLGDRHAASVALYYVILLRYFPEDRANRNRGSSDQQDSGHGQHSSERRGKVKHRTHPSCPTFSRDRVSLYHRTWNSSFQT